MTSIFDLQTSLPMLRAGNAMGELSLEGDVVLRNYFKPPKATDDARVFPAAAIDV